MWDSAQPEVTVRPEEKKGRPRTQMSNVPFFLFEPKKTRNEELSSKSKDVRIIVRAMQQRGVIRAIVTIILLP